MQRYVTDTAVTSRAALRLPDAESPSGHLVFYLRVYAPSKSVVDGDSYPPAAIQIEESGKGNKSNLASAANKNGT